jgi:hypothetical protein
MRGVAQGWRGHACEQGNMGAAPRGMPALSVSSRARCLNTKRCKPTQQRSGSKIMTIMGVAVRVEVGVEATVEITKAVLATASRHAGWVCELLPLLLT